MTTLAFVTWFWQDIETSLPTTDNLAQYSVEDDIKALLHYKLSKANNSIDEREPLIQTYITEVEMYVDEAATFTGSRGTRRQEEIDLVHSSIRWPARSERFMVAKRGHIGMAPATARTGDISVKIFGSKTCALMSNRNG